MTFYTQTTPWGILCTLKVQFLAFLCSKYHMELSEHEMSQIEMFLNSKVSAYKTLQISDLIYRYIQNGTIYLNGRSTKFYYTLTF